MWESRMWLTVHNHTPLASVEIPISDRPSKVFSVSGKPARGSKLSLGILTHLNTVFQSEDVVENQVKSLTSGPDSSVFQDVFIFYDTNGLPDDYMNMSAKDKRGMVGKWIRFSNKMEYLRSQGLVSKYIPMKRNSSIPAAMGSRDDRQRDAAMYAIYQLLMEECQTEYCAFLTQDIIAHGGGGLQHAMQALENDESLVFAIPPLACQKPIWNTENDIQMRNIFMRFDGTKPYHSRIGVIDQHQIEKNVSCAVIGNQRLSTRYLVAARERFPKSIPFSPIPEKDSWFENHPGVVEFTSRSDCLSGNNGYLLHPPPWHHGKQLFESCRNIETLQQAVDSPNNLVIDKDNNMIMENWTAACYSISNSSQQSHTGA